MHRADLLEEVRLGAIDLAKERRNSTVTPSHLLLRILEDPDFIRLAKTLRIDPNSMRGDIERNIFYSDLHGEKLAVTEPIQSWIFTSIISAAYSSIIDSRRDENAITAILRAIISEIKDPASLLLTGYGITNKLLIQHTLPTEYADAFDKVGSEYGTTAFSHPHENLVPHQTSAPVRVEERAGRLVPVSDRSKLIGADKLDFDRWRAPVAAGLRDLLDDDLGPGTNHPRLRKRLLALAEALAGTIDDVKANQFQLGYAIESLGVLVAVYRDPAGDMPALNAAVFGDVDHLHIQLMLGLSKLVAWQRFQRSADEDEYDEGAADAGAVGAALEAAAAVLEGEAAAPVIDPELPRAFRWLRATIADPAGTTRRMIYGAVGSLKNVVSFLGQIALRPARAVAKDLSGAISKAVAAHLVVALGSAALALSAALTNSWPWLKPLLDAAARLLHG